MNDLISRQAAIDAICKACTNGDDYVNCRDRDIKSTWCDNMAALRDLPSAQPEQRWIPTTERLPKYGKTVIITNDKGNVRCGRFRGVEFWKDDGDSYWTFKGNTVEHVLAWMPLPEPWRGEEHEAD